MGPEPQEDLTCGGIPFRIRKDPTAMPNVSVGFTTDYDFSLHMTKAPKGAQVIVFII